MSPRSLAASPVVVTVMMMTYLCQSIAKTHRETSNSLDARGSEKTEDHTFFPRSPRGERLIKNTTQFWILSFVERFSLRRPHSLISEKRPLRAAQSKKLKEDLPAS